jgi:hypothetical protein
MVTKAHFEPLLEVSLKERALVELADQRYHRFDLASPDDSVLLICETAPVTSISQESMVRLQRAKHDALLLLQSRAARRLIVFDDPIVPGRETLSARFCRQNSIWLGDVEIWRHAEGSLSKVE